MVIGSFPIKSLTNMKLLSEQQIIKKIEHRKPFSARIESGAFDIKIDSYVPVVGTAIHHGHRVDLSYQDRLLLSEEQRRYEEDPYTGELIGSLPITVVVNDSRYFYDLNRHPDRCIYDVAWGKKVWRRPFDTSEVESIRAMHATYYRLLSCLMTELERLHKRVIVFDLHSYNYSRIKRDTPLFNIGTHYIDDRYQPLLRQLQRQLEAITLPGIENRSVFDEVFEGKGYQAAVINKNHPLSLCIPLEIKKIFMNEDDFLPKEKVCQALKKQLSKVLAESAMQFSEDVHRENSD